MQEIEVNSVISQSKKYTGAFDERGKVNLLLATNVGEVGCVVTLTGKKNEDGVDQVDFSLYGGDYTLSDMDSIWVAQSAFPDADFGGDEI